MKMRRIMLLGGVFLLSIGFVGAALAGANQTYLATVSEPAIQNQVSLTQKGVLPPADVLLVDDDDNTPDVVYSYTQVLDALGYSYVVWDTSFLPDPTLVEFINYPSVIWFSGDAFGGFSNPVAGPGPAAENDLSIYLDNYGGCLFISSQDYLYDRGATMFMINYLGVLTGTNDVAHTVVTGTNTYAGLGPYFFTFPLTNYSDAFTLTTDADAAFYGNSRRRSAELLTIEAEDRAQTGPASLLAGPTVAGAHKNTGFYKTTFLGFPLELIPFSIYREQVLNRFLVDCFSEDILVVDDDNDYPGEIGFYTQTLDLLGYNYAVWDTLLMEREPSRSDLTGYEAVVWFSGDAYASPPDPPTYTVAGPNWQSEIALANWLDETGACLFLSSQDYIYDNGGITPFMNDYLGVSGSPSPIGDVFQTQVTGTHSYGGLGPYTLNYSGTTISNFSDAFSLTQDVGVEAAFIGDRPYGNITTTQMLSADSPRGNIVLSPSGTASRVAGANKNNGWYQTTWLGFPLETIPDVFEQTRVVHRFLANCFETDLDVDKFSSDPVVDVGQTFTYTVLVHNYGPHRAVNVAVSDFVPKQVTILGVKPTLAACNNPMPLINHVNCLIPKLEVGQVEAIDLVVTPNQPGGITNFVFATDQGADTDPTNNSTSSFVHVLPPGYTAPIVNNVVQDDGSNSAEISLLISGANFNTGTKIFLDDIELISVTVGSEAELFAYIPAGFPPGSYSVKAQNPNGELDVLFKGVVVYDPNALAIDSVDPDFGANDRPVMLKIFGDGFAPGMTGRLIDSSNALDSYPLENMSFVSGTLVRAGVPWGINTGIYDVELTNPANISETLPMAYRALDGFVIDDLFSLDFDLFTIPASPRAGENVQVGLTVRRRTGEFAPLASVQVGVDVNVGISGSGLYAPQPLIQGTGIISPNSTISMTSTWPVGPAGEYTLTVNISSPDLPTDSVPTNNVVSRMVTVLPPSSDSSPPQIDSLTINNGAFSTSAPQVVVNTTASDSGSGVAYIYYVEYAFERNLGDWQPVGVSGWKPFSSASVDLDWVLDPTPGIHYIQAWVSDQAGNVSQPATVPINFIPSKNFIVHDGGQIFRLPLNAGDTIQINLTSLTGNADMYVWGPDGSLVAMAEGFNSLEQVIFTAPVAGVYQVDVFGYEYGITSYWFEVTPLGFGLAPNVVEGHVQGGNRPLQVVDEDPGADNAIPLPPVNEHVILLPLIIH